MYIVLTLTLHLDSASDPLFSTLMVTILTQFIFNVI
jgi:hypothetical protein